MIKSNNTRLPLRVDAVIFDMDGLMLDTERLHLDHFRKAADDFGYPDLEAVYMQSVGLNSRDTERLFAHHFGESFPYADIRNRWREYAEDHVNRFGVPHKSGLTALLKTIQDRGLPKAVATSTKRDMAVALLKKVDLLQHFDAIVGGDEVSKGKPNPEIFLKAAERLNIHPARCVVFEDSPAGIRGAHAAGMIPILVPDLIQPPDDVRALACRVIRSLEEASIFF